MKYLFAAGSRSGSEFSIELVSALLGELPSPFARVHSARESQGAFEPNYALYKSEGRIVDFVEENDLTALKLEDPGVDDDAYRLFDAFPDATVIATFRPLDKIINSHGNIRPWGMAPERVARNWSENLVFYEHAHRAGRLVMIPLEERDRFDAGRAAEVLGAPVPPGWEAFQAGWPVINDLVTQKEISRDATDISFRMDRQDVLDAFPDTEVKEQRYRDLL